jgi:hypothetical protein
MKGRLKLIAGLAAIAAGASAHAANANAPDPAITVQTAPAQEPSNAELEQRIDALESELQASEQRQGRDRGLTDAAVSAATGWWSDTTLSGRMYYDISNVDQKTNGSRTGTANGTSFDIKRFYIGVDHTFNSVFSADVTTDFTYDSTAGASQIYIKKAYLQAKLSDALVLRLGSADMPWIPFVENIYGYRYVENTLIDRTKYGTSADWGVHASGKLYGGILNYAFSVVNGAGYKKANLFRTNGPDYEGRVDLDYDGFTLGVGGYNGKLGAQFGTRVHHDASRFDAVAAYTMDALRLGVEYVTERNFNSVTSTVSNDSANGVSAFASYQFEPEWSVFGRYDHLRKKITGTGAATIPDDYFNVGVSYSPVKNVDFSLVYKHESASGGTLSTSNGTIGGPVNGTYNEVGLFGQVRW